MKESGEAGEEVMRMLCDVGSVVRWPMAQRSQS